MLGYNYYITEYSLELYIIELNRSWGDMSF